MSVQRIEKLSVIQKLAWTAVRPSLYGEAFRKASRRVNNALRLGATRREHLSAESWCETNAVEVDKALIELTGTADHPVFDEVHSTAIAEANRRAADCPYVMGGAANLQLLYALAEHFESKNVIETGVAYGWSTLALQLSLSKRPDHLLISIDRPYIGFDASLVGCVLPDELRAGWKLIQRADREGLPVALRELPEIDLCHYDSDKDREGRLWAYPKLWDALRPGGVFISDDIQDDLGFRDFCREIRRSPLVIRTPQTEQDKYVGIVVK